MNLPRLLLVGAGGHARACIDVIETSGQWQIAGLIGLPEEVGTRVLGYPVLASDDELTHVLQDVDGALITLGQIKSPERRQALFATVEARGRATAPVISPRAHVSTHSQVGAGTIVMHGAVVNAGATVGRNCILNTLSLVEHDAIVGDHCHISTHAVLNSGVVVGDGAFVGSGSCVRQGQRIGDRSVIGMGQVVVKDCEPGSRLPLRSAR